MGVKGIHGRSFLIVFALSLLALISLLAVVLRQDSAPAEVLHASAPRGPRGPEERGLRASLPELPFASERVMAPVLELSAASLTFEPEWSRPDYDALILALAHDNVPRNALEAFGELRDIIKKFPPRSWVPYGSTYTDKQLARLDAKKAACNELVGKLGAALGSRDYQQRQLAACVLSHCQEGPYPAGLSSTLVNGLRYDNIEGWNCGVNNAARAVRFFAQHPEVVSEALYEIEAAQFSDDGQQRFLSAFILARASRAEAAPTACPLLIAQLRADGVVGGALMAHYALRCLGRSARPYLMNAFRVSYRTETSNLLEEVINDIDQDRRPESRRAHAGRTATSSNYIPLSIVDWGSALSGDRLYTPL